ncbi:MAG TPA: hypothetical protein PKE39_07190 [Ignavibacteria bacterium]|nr:hypothetical protein [Ignavibacteria bacterium]
MIAKYFKWAALFLIIPYGVLAQSDFTDVQTFIDSNITRNFFLTYFDNNKNTAALISRFNFYKKHKRFNVFVKNYYSSSVTKLNENLYRDFDNVKITGGYAVSNSLNISANYFGQFFSDDRTFQLKGSSSNMGYMSALYDNVVNGSQIYSTLNAGYKVESQYDELNKGPSISGDFSIYNLNLSDFLVDGQLRLGYESLDPRKKSLVYSRIYFEKPFENNLARNEFDGTFSRVRKDFYFPADNLSVQQFGIRNNIEKRVENIFKFYNRFDYTISDNVAVVFNLNPDYRRITKENTYVPVTTNTQPSIYDTDIQELSFAGDIALNFQFRKLDYQIKAYYRERDEKHFLMNPNRINGNFVNIIENNEATKNNHSSIFKLNGNVYYNIDLMNRVELSGSASILKYDTQSDLNYDDRDELGYLVYVAHRFNNLRNLVLVTSFDVNLYHTVYILAQKSSNNNWNRVIRFTSKSFFEPSDNFRNVGTFSVLANYTVYDFQDIISSVKSYSFRQLNLKDSLIVRFSRHFGADIYGEVKLYERGELNWNDFTQRPVNYFEDKIINSELNYFFNNFITFSGGYRWFEQRKFNYLNGERVFDNYVRTTGPFVKIRAEWKRNSVIELLGTYDYYRYGDGSPGSDNGNVYLNASWNF